MSKLYLYTVFHTNLAFSSIPESDHSVVIERCYWPLLNIIEKLKIQIGWEFTGYTLEKIKEIDPNFIERLRERIREKKIEIIGSGYCQIISPLIPERINSYNLKKGNEIYNDILGFVPHSGYVNEQTYSSGLVKLYKEAGYKNIIMDWNNPYKYNKYPKEYRYFPQIVVGSDNDKIIIIWNNSISFQKFQRYIYKDISFTDYIRYLNSHYSEKENRSFILYGNDLEIFDYRPGRKDISRRNEFKKIEELFRYLLDQKKFSLITPSFIVSLFKKDGHRMAFNQIKLETPEWPIPAKKQEKYNVTRWAVCGRENTIINTKCFKLYLIYQNICALSKILRQNIPYDILSEICYLWSSDFRTNIDNKKYAHLVVRLNEAEKKLARLYHKLLSKIGLRNDFLLINPHRFTGKSIPCEVNLGPFAKRTFKNEIGVQIHDKLVQSQIEEKKLYPDGSLCKAKVVLTPNLKPFEIADCKIYSRKAINNKNIKIDGLTIETPQVKVEFIKRRGGNIKEATFKKISSQPLIGTIPHGYFEDISYSADWYTGEMILFTRDGKKITDLETAEIKIPQDLDSFSIRIPIEVIIDVPFGSLIKTYYIYLNEPRIDLQYEFNFKELRPVSFRLGFVAFLPESFNQNGLFFTTVNGGRSIEKFLLSGRKINHAEAVSPLVSAKHCLGATEGWVSIGDREKQILIASNNRDFYSVPMIEYTELEDKFFLIVCHSINELDETTQSLWRGYYKITFSYYAHRDINELRKKSAFINQGLIIKMLNI